MRRGVNRLAIFLGIFGGGAAVVWALYDILVVSRASLPLASLLQALSVVASIGFLVPFAFVHGAAWVVRGFLNPPS